QMLHGEPPRHDFSCEAEGSRRGQAPNGTARRRFVARWRGVWREPYERSMEWTCDLRELWVTRQRVERGRVTGACNRKILSAGTGVLHSSRSGVAVKTSSSVPPTLRFGVFELDPQAGELRKKGMKIRLQGQPVEILAMLLQRPGETITREELQKKLWPVDTFVDFEQGLNNAIKRLRASL